MKAGDARTYLLLQAPNIVVGPDGGENVTWPTSVPAWGDVTPNTGREYLSSSVVSDAVDVKITIRRNPNALPTARWRVVDPTSNVIYSVMAQLYAQTNDTVVLLCKTVTGGGDGR